MKIDYLAIPEIVVSYKDKVKASERATIKCSQDAYDILQTIFEDCVQHHEEVYALYLNRRFKLLGVYCIGKGGLSTCPADIKMILQIALKTNAGSIMLSHNHPSGNLEPSVQDKSLTSRIKEVCRMLDLVFLDHIIMTDESYYSFADEGLL